MPSTVSVSSFLVIAALAVSAASVTAQSRLLTNGQLVAELNDTPIGVPAGQFFGGTTAFDFPVMSRQGNILFRGQLSGTGVSALNDRGLYLGRTKADLALLVRGGSIDPSGTYPNSQLLRVLTTTGVGVDTDLFSTPRISPLGNRVLFHAQLYDGGNPGADGLIHTTAMGLVNDNVLYTGTPGALQILAQQGMVMPGGATLSFTSALITQTATSLNSAGTAIFKTNLLGGDVVGTTNNNAWIRGIPGSLSYFVRKGDLVLGGANGIGTVGANCVINEAGDVLHDQVLSTSLGSSPATTANDGILFIRPVSTGVDTPLMREGDLAVDPTGAPMPGVFYGFYSLSSGFGPGATAAFLSTMTGAVTTANDRALFVGGLGSLQMVARDGDVVPGTGGETIDVLNNTTSYAASHGVLFGCTLLSPGVGVTINNDSVLVLAKPNSGMTLIVREGAPCPGLPAGYVFGIAAGTYNFGSSTQQRLNDRGQILFFTLVNNGGPNVSVLYSWDPVHGLQLQQASGDVMGSGTVTAPAIPVTQPTGDGNQLGFNEDGDFCGRSTLMSGHHIVRGHVGSLQGLPSAVPAAGGVPQAFQIDCGPAQAGYLYFLLATGLGTDPGFVSPFGGQLVSLNPDPLWTDLSLNNPNSIVWPGSLGFLDAQGMNVGPAAFLMPPGFPGFLGTTLHHAAVVLDISAGIATTFASEPVPCYLY